MKEQVSRCQSKGLTAQFVGSGQTHKKCEEVECGRCQLVSINPAPEALVCALRWWEVFSNSLILYQAKLVGFAVDECHLFKTWVCLAFERKMPRSVKFVLIGTSRSLSNGSDSNS